MAELVFPILDIRLQMLFQSSGQVSAYGLRGSLSEFSKSVVQGLLGCQATNIAEVFFRWCLASVRCLVLTSQC